MKRHRARHQTGWIELTKTNQWKAHWHPWVRDAVTGEERRLHRSRIVGQKATMRRFEAEEELRKLVAEAQGAPGYEDSATVGWFIDKRWRPLYEGGWKASTVTTNDYLLGKLKDRFGKARIAELDGVEMQDWLNELARKHSRGVVWHVRIFLKSICDEMVEQDFLAKNPARRLKRPQTDKPDETVLEWSEFQRVLEELEPRDRLLVKLAGASAVRPGELFAFRWRCLKALDGKRLVLVVEETVYRGELRSWAKTESSEDYVPLPVTLGEELLEWRKVTRYAADEDYIFPNSQGGFISKDNYLNRVLYPVRKKLGLEKLNFQVMRRTFATRAYGEHKGTLKDVQRQLRHSKPATTLENYVKEIPESVFQMVDSIYDEIAPAADLANMKPASGREQ